MERTSVGYGEGRNRTGDPTVFSRVLYQLSYLAEGGQSSPGSCSRIAAGGDMRGAGTQRPGSIPKEGAHGGTLGSPVLDPTVFSRVLYQLSYLAEAASV